MLELEPINKEEFDRGIMFTVHVGGMGYVTADGEFSAAPTFHKKSKALSLMFACISQKFKEITLTPVSLAA